MKKQQDDHEQLQVQLQEQLQEQYRQTQMEALKIKKQASHVQSISELKT